MTQEEFDNTGFTGLMRCEYKGKVFDIEAVDFEERLIGINETNNADEEYQLDWKRCENVELTLYKKETE